MAFAADFVDLFEIRGMTRLRRGLLRAPRVGASDVLLSYLGLDDRERYTHLHFDPMPTELTESRARFDVTVPPGQRIALFTRISCERIETGNALPKQFLISLREAMQSRHSVLPANAERQCNLPMFCSTK